MLSRLYYNPSKGFSSLQTLFAKAKEINPNITKPQVKAFLDEQPIFQKTFAPRKRRFNTGTIAAPRGYYQMDLTFFPKYASANDGYIGLLTCINMNSRKGYAIPVKAKTRNSTVVALEELISQIQDTNKIIVLQSDKGGEFNNIVVQQFLYSNDIEQEFLTRKSQAGMIERFNRTLKGILLRYFLHKNTVRYVDVLDQIVSNYNQNPHSTLSAIFNESTTPDDIDGNAERELDIMYAGIAKNFEDASSPFNVGDTVRIKIPKQKFDKEGQIWSDDIFLIEKVNKTSVVLQGGIRKKFNEVLRVHRQTLDRKTRQTRPNAIDAAARNARAKRRLDNY